MRRHLACRASAPPRRSPSAWPDRSRARSRRAASPSVSSQGQPNIALSQPALTKPVITGLRMSAETQEVMKAFQPPGLGGLLLGAARDDRLPVHRLHVDLEAGLLHQLTSRPARGWSARAGRSSASARPACRRSPLPSGARAPSGSSNSSRPCHALVGGERGAADEHRLADLVVGRVADHRVEEVLLVERVPERLADLRVVERLVQLVRAEGVLVAERVPVDELDVRRRP